MYYYCYGSKRSEGICLNIFRRAVCLRGHIENLNWRLITVLFFTNVTWLKTKRLCSCTHVDDPNVCHVQHMLS